MPNKPQPRVPAYVKAHTTGRWAETIFRALSSRIAKRWKFVSFRGTNKGEWRGIVDIIAIRKNTTQPVGNLLKRGDLFDIILIQIKGGASADPSENDLRRLCKVAEFYNAKKVVQFRWLKGRDSGFSELGTDMKWNRTTSKALFR